MLLLLTLKYYQVLQECQAESANKVRAKIAYAFQLNPVWTCKNQKQRPRTTRTNSAIIPANKANGIIRFPNYQLAPPESKPKKLQFPSAPPRRVGGPPHASIFNCEIQTRASRCKIGPGHNQKTHLKTQLRLFIYPSRAAGAGDASAPPQRRRSELSPTSV